MSASPPPSSSPLPLSVDTHLLKLSQGSIVALTALAFLFNAPWLVAVTTLALGLSAILPAYSPFRIIYRAILIPANILRPHIVADDPAPHRFAQGVGTVFTLSSTVFLMLTPLHGLGWTLDILVFILSGLNFFVGFCAGCFVYYQLGRIGLMPHVRYEGGFRWRGVA